MKLTIADIPAVLPLLNRCVQMDAAKLEELLLNERCRAAWISKGTSAIGVVVAVGDKDGYVVYLARDLSQGDPTVLSQLVKQVRLMVGGNLSIPATLVLDGLDAEVAAHFRSQEFWEIDCDYLLSVISYTIPTELTVRPYQAEELPLYTHVFDQAFEPHRSANGREPYALWSARPEWAKEWFETAAARGDMGSIWVDGQMAACYRLDGDTIDSLAVLPEMQGRGLGRSVINYCIDQIRRRGYPRVYLYVAETNLRARRLYEEMGFRTEGVTRILTNTKDE